MRSKLLTTGIVGTVIAAICCVAPAAAIAFGAAGIFAWVAEWNAAIVGIFLVSAMLCVYAVLRHRRQRIQ